MKDIEKYELLVEIGRRVAWSKDPNDSTLVPNDLLVRIIGALAPERSENVKGGAPDA